MSETPITRHLSVWVDADWQSAYAVVSDQSGLPEWAAGLADPQFGLEVTDFAPTNDFGVVDHVVRMPSGEEVFNPMRVIRADTPGTCEIVFTLRRRSEQSAEQFDVDAAAVRKDLMVLKALIED